MIGQVRRLARRASALLLVTGLISILAVIAAVFLLRTREDADAAQPLLREAQARLMLSAACLYVLESSRLGWGEPGHGWIDNRNGSIGPRPPRNDLGQIPQPTWWKIGSYPKDDSEDVSASIPPKVPWDDYGYAQSDLAGGNESNRIDYWPHPGGVCRSEMARWVIPPYATTAHYTMNPVQVTTDFMPGSAANYSMGVWPPGYHQYADAQNALRGIRDAALQRAPFFLQPQPVADSHGDQTSPVSGSDFVSGQRIANGTPITSPLSPAPVFAPASMNRGWFRVYRELPSEHDGVPTMVGSLSEPYFDTIAISEPHPTVAGKYLRSSDAVFVITCGAGATAGFRTWNEVVHCGAAQRFGVSGHRLRCRSEIGKQSWQSRTIPRRHRVLGQDPGRGQQTRFRSVHLDPASALRTTALVKTVLRRAFTAIEMLVVIVIIILLGSLVMAGANILAEQRKPVMTRNAMQAVLSALGGRAALIGGNTGSAEHPLAGTADVSVAAGGSGRPRFRRKTGGSLVSVTGEALEVGNLAWVPGAGGRVVLPDDCFEGIVAAQDLPLLFGVERRRCRVLGGAVGIGTPAGTFPGITAYRRLDPPRVGTGTLPGTPNFDKALYPDPQHLVSPTGEDGTITQETIQTRSLETALGPGGIEELARLGCIKTSTAGTLILQRRALIDPAETATFATWSPGCYQRSDGRWQIYRLRGPIVVDGWGREMLCWNENGLRFASAGKDGVFVCAPGPDQIISSAAHTAATIRAGDDRDGSVDNLASQP